jgi:hypothetical protein
MRGNFSPDTDSFVEDFEHLSAAADQYRAERRFGWLG